MCSENKPFCGEGEGVNRHTTQQNKNSSGVPLRVVLEDFVPVTSHFGYRLELFFLDEYYFIYRSDRVVPGEEVTARCSRGLARSECKYLEKGNFKAGD